jgi:hypothetical protein
VRLFVSTFAKHGHGHGSSRRTLRCLCRG